MVPEGWGYTKTHEWAKRDGSLVTVGITQHAQEELKDIVFVELPAVGKDVQAGQPCAVVESVKAAFDIYAPVSGKVMRVNEELVRKPQLINEDCYGPGWLFAVTPSEPAEFANLLPADAYRQQLEAAK